VELVGVQYPGRANRINTPPYRKIVDLVKELAPLLSAYTADKPYALFGHSLGGTIAFEVIRELKRIKAKLPIKLFIGDRGFPRTPEEAAELSDSDSDDEDPPSWQRSDEQFIEKLRKLEGTPPEILANTELMKMCLPSLRADFEMCDEQFIIDETVPLELPITVFGGMNSKHHSKSRLQGWSKRTSSSDFIVRMVPGIMPTLIFY
jgi:medium-chain acyl-[acyl-carrier-protein] hydrolase